MSQRACYFKKTLSLSHRDIQGDVQPFLALGQELIKYGHTVRLGTHAIFEPLVRKHGLQFFSIGGDPAQLMAVSRLKERVHERSLMD